MTIRPSPRYRATRRRSGSIEFNQAGFASFDSRRARFVDVLLLIK
jgi:hypothetical protein